MQLIPEHQLTSHAEQVRFPIRACLPASDELKIRRTYTWILCLCLLGLLLASSSAAREHAFTTFTGEDGLSQLTVTALLQDHQGYIWVGTQAGLNRFDGERFESFTTQDGLAGDHIRALIEDSDGSIWVATTGGLSRFTDGHISSYSTADGLPHANVLSLAVTSDGILWCGTENGAARRRGEGFETVVPKLAAGKLGIDEPSLDDLSIDELLLDRSGRFWIGSHKGLFSLVDDELQKIPVLQSRRIYALAEDELGRLWVASPGRIEAFDDQWRPVITLTDADTGVSELGWHGVSMASSRHGEIWIGVETGTIRYRQGEATFFGERQGLPLIHVLTILEDREGVLWLGGLGGLSRFLGRAFTTYTLEDGLPSSNVRPILRDSKDRLWVGTAQGLAYSDGEDWSSLTREDGLPQNYLMALAEDLDGKIWIGTSAGLVYYQNGQIQNDPDWPSKSSIGSLDLSEDGTLWLAAAGIGLVKRLPAIGTFETVPIPGNRFSDSRMIVDREDQIWISGDLGLSRWDGDTWTTYTEEDGLAAATVYSLCEDGKGGVWFGYFASAGLTHFNGHRFRTFTTSDGLADNSIYSLGLDAQNRLWAGSARGIDRFDGTYFRNYGKVEGYASTESNAGGFFADRDGTLWLGTAEGLSHYDPRTDPPLESPLILKLEELTIDQITISRPNDKFPQGATLRARITALTSANRKQVELRYRLDGFHDSWQALLSPELLIPNITAGSYSLEVQGRRYGEPWTSLSSQSFTIRSPIWQTPGFFLFALLGTVLATVSLTRIRTAQLEKQNARLENEVRRRSREFESARKAAEAANRAKGDFLAHMSHEIRTPLNAVIGLTSVLKNADLRSQEKTQVETIEQSGRLLLALISNVLDFSDIEAGIISFDAQPFDLRIAVQASLDLVAQEANEKALLVSTRIDDDVPRILVGDTARFLQILWNLLSNAIRFTPEGEIRISISRRTEEKEDRLIVAVQDTGIGIPEDRQQEIFGSFQLADASITRNYGGTGLGLTIVKRLLSLMDGEIHLRSKPGVGSTFTVDLPLKQAKTDSGTALHSELKDPLTQAGLRILIVDDNPVNRLVLETILADLGHSSDMKEDGKQAAEAVLEQTYDLVLMDVHMPVLDGIGACRLIRRTFSSEQLPIVAVTADVIDSTRKRCWAAGMNDVLPKPIGVEDLESVLRKVRPTGP